SSTPASSGFQSPGSETSMLSCNDPLGHQKGYARYYHCRTNRQFPRSISDCMETLNTQGYALPTHRVRNTRYSTVLTLRSGRVRKSHLSVRAGRASQPSSACCCDSIRSTKELYASTDSLSMHTTSRR